MDPVIGIIGGNGQMGKLFANFFRERGVKVLISDVKTKLTNIELTKKANILIISVPINCTKKVIREIVPYVKKNQALLDITSLKDEPVKEMLKGNSEVMGMHPMFGSTNPIPGQTIILCPTKKSGILCRYIEDFLRKNNVNIIKLSPSEHDRLMNIAQGLIHFSEIAFIDALKDLKIPVKKLLQYTGKASELKVELAARLIAQDPGLYANIQIQNPEALRSLDVFKKSIEKLYNIVRKKDLSGFIKYFNENKKYLGQYREFAYEESAYLIDKVLENRRSKKMDRSPKKLFRNSIALLGPANTFSDIATTKYLHEKNLKNEKYFAHDIDEIFELVEKGKVSFGVIPLENKLEGSVRESLDALFYKKVHIDKLLTIPIHHCLICLEHTHKNDIKKIISHSQALRQCKKFLHKNFPKVSLEAYTSTSAAIEKLLAAYDKTLAVIAPEVAAFATGLKILNKNIEDEKDNSTNFAVIKKGEQKLGTKTAHASAHSKTSIAFYFHKDSPGSLFTVFKDFAEARINLTKVESRKSKSEFGDYIFYLDFEGDYSSAKIKKVLEKVSKKVAVLKILGSFY